MVISQYMSMFYQMVIASELEPANADRVEVVRVDLRDAFELFDDVYALSTSL